MNEHLSEANHMNQETGEKQSFFVYRDNRDPERKIIFTCIASILTEADKLYTQALGNDPIKQFYVGCEVLPAEKVTDKEYELGVGWKP